MSDLKFKVGDVVYAKGVVCKTDGRDKRYPYNVVHDHLTIDWYNEDQLYTLEDLKNNNEIDELWSVIKRLLFGDLSSHAKRDSIFDTESLAKIINRMSPQDVIAKVREYDENCEIRIGDIVENPNFGVGVVLEIDKVTNSCIILAEKGTVRLGFDKNSLTKTGRSIDISKLLEEIKKEDA